jgi:hypothetical protein
MCRHRELSLQCRVGESESEYEVAILHAITIVRRI